MVIRLYKYLEIPISEDKPKGKVFCVIDTDAQRSEEFNKGNSNLTIKRLCNKDKAKQTSLLSLDNKITIATDIEQSLNPDIFKDTLEELNNNDDYAITETIDDIGNTDFRENFRSLQLEEYFKENKGENKVLFALKYIEYAAKDYFDDTHPNWIAEIKEFLKQK